MTTKELLNKYGDTLFSFHKIERLKAHYINTYVGIAITGFIEDHSNLDLTETGHALSVELEKIEITKIP